PEHPLPLRPGQAQPAPRRAVHHARRLRITSPGHEAIKPPPTDKPRHQPQPASHRTTDHHSDTTDELSWTSQQAHPSPCARRIIFCDSSADVRVWTQTCCENNGKPRHARRNVAT